jgi:hypothetical protein
MDLWSARWFSFITDLITPDIFPFCNFKFGAYCRISVFPFLIVVPSLAGCLCPTVFQSELIQVLFLLANYHESSSLFWPSGPSIWLPRLLPIGVATGQSLGPSFWDSWPPLSFALPDQPPPPDHRKNHLIWVDSIPVIPLAWGRMSLERLVGSRKLPTTLVSLSM